MQGNINRPHCYKQNNVTSDNATDIYCQCIVVWEFFATDVEGIESVGAVSAAFEQVFLRFGEFLAGFVLTIIA